MINLCYLCHSCSNPHFDTSPLNSHLFSLKHSSVSSELSSVSSWVFIRFSLGFHPFLLKIVRVIPLLSSSVHGSEHLINVEVQDKKAQGGHVRKAELGHSESRADVFVLRSDCSFILGAAA